MTVTVDELQMFQIVPYGIQLCVSVKTCDGRTGAHGVISLSLLLLTGAL